MKKKHKKKLNIKRLLLVIIFIVFIIIFVKNNIFDNHPNLSNKILNILDNSSSEYTIIKQDNNNKYSGAGQEKVSNKDGYYTTFTTNSPYKKTYIEYKQNGNASWSKNTYWNDYMENSGCGITAMSIILSGYEKNATPEDLRNKYYPKIDYDNMNYEFYNSFDVKTSEFYYDSEHLSKDYINDHLLSNRPILVCVWTNPSKNRWTTSSHYMVLLASDGDNMLYISNPNGGINDSKSSGWYNFDEIVPYIAKAIFIESYN